MGRCHFFEEFFLIDFDFIYFLLKVVYFFWRCHFLKRLFFENFIFFIYLRELFLEKAVFFPCRSYFSKNFFFILLGRINFRKKKGHFLSSKVPFSKDFFSLENIYFSIYLEPIIFQERKALFFTCYFSRNIFFLESVSFFNPFG